MRDGRLVPELSKDCLFACEYHGGYIALRDHTGLYLSPIGSRAVLKTRSNVVTKDELFSLEDSLPQASFQAVSNQRFVSIKQGVDVTANQEEISNHETFQLEFEAKAGKREEASRLGRLEEPTQPCLTSTGSRTAPSPSRPTTASLSAQRSPDISLPTLTLLRTVASSSST